MVRPKLTMGKGAKVSCITKNLHPSSIVNDFYPNMPMGHRLGGLEVVRLEEKRINRRMQLAVVVVHDEIVSVNGTKIELHAARRWYNVEEEGPRDLFFEDSNTGGEETEATEVTLPLQVQQAMNGSLTAEKLSVLDGLVEIDDDNQPAPENVPEIKSGATNNNIMGEWSNVTVCQRLCVGAVNMPPRLNWFPRDAKPDLVSLFLVLFPKKYLEEIILVETNKNLQSPSPLKMGEFLRWLGIWFLMATTYVTNRREFWSAKNSSAFEGAPFRLNDYMSRKRFEDILQALRLTSATSPQFKDRFFEVRDLIEAWNQNMRDMFTPGWISCLDESMSKWLSEYTCPGFMCVPRKPWPYGNEYHTIACGVSGVLYALELVEGKDTPPERPRKEFEVLGKTVGLLLRLTKVLWGTSKVVVLDSGFCVLKGLVELRKKGVFASALIKKRRYWPKYIPGDEIKKHFEEKEVGVVDCWGGELDGTKFHVQCMKEPEYVMSLMTTYGTSSRFGEEQTRYEKNKKTTKFRYPEVVHNHFAYRDSVDNHNSARMDPIALEETWKTTRWPLRVFQFLLAVTEVNVRRVREYMFADDKNEGTTQQEFRKQFAFSLIFNQRLEDEELSPRTAKRRRRNRNDGHELISLGPFENFRGSRIVKTKTRCTQRRCSCGARRCNTYCKCTPGVFYCSSCFVDHVSEAITTN